jgi:TrpR-related protein YerC/YecD
MHTGGSGMADRPEKYSKDIDFLYDAILQLKNRDECFAFFDDICTIAELQAISQRLQVAKLLREKITYQEISKKTGASTATISRVNRCVVYGTGGYDLVLERLK